MIPMIEATNPAATADKFALLHTPDRPAIRQELTLQELNEVLGIPGDNECEFATLNTSKYSQYVEPNGKIPITCVLNENRQILGVQLNNNAHVEVASLCNDLVGTNEPTFSECRETFKGLGKPGSTTVIKIDYPPGLDQNGVIRIGDAPFIEAAPDPADFVNLSELLVALSDYTYPNAQNTQVPSPELESWNSQFTPEQEKKYENLIDKLTYGFISVVGALGLLGLVAYIKDKLTYVEDVSEQDIPNPKQREYNHEKGKIQRMPPEEFDTWMGYIFNSWMEIFINNRTKIAEELTGDPNANVSFTDFITSGRADIDMSLSLAESAVTGHILYDSDKSPIENYEDLMELTRAARDNVGVLHDPVNFANGLRSALQESKERLFIDEAKGAVKSVSDRRQPKLGK